MDKKDKTLERYKYHKDYYVHKVINMNRKQILAYSDESSETSKILKDGIWIRYWMESGRGHNTIKETYIFYKYEDGYTESDIEIFLDDAYNWAGNDMGGFKMMGFESDFEIVEKPSDVWITDELIRSHEKMANLGEHVLRLLRYRKL